MRSFLLATIVILSCGAAAIGQSFNGNLVGTVKDASGAVLPGVELRLTRVETGQVRNLLSDERGDFSFVQLPVGSYELDAEFQGFKSAARKGITVRTDTTARVDFAMEVGDISDKIMVTADAPLLESETSSVGNLINNRTVVDLPLNGRKFETLVFLSPGAALPRPGSSVGFRGGVQFGGLRETANMFILDGIDITDNDVRQPAIRPSVDAIQEFKVQNSMYPAEYGRTAGGMISVTTKSGTNNLHGSLYEFVRNDIFDAKDYFASPTEPAPPLRRNQFGGTLGGPLSLGSLYHGKDRTFFFVNYEGLRERKSDTRVALTPRPEWLRGDFSSLLSPELGSKTVQLMNSLTGQPFAGNIIPQNMLNGPSLLAAQVYPLANAGTGALGNKFRSSPSLDTDTSLFTMRVDHQIRANNNFFVRYSYSHEYIIDPFDAYNGISDLPYFGRTDLTLAHAATVSDVWTISPSVVNELRAGFSRFFQDRRNDNNFDFHSAAGLKNFQISPLQTGYPGITIAGFTIGKSGLPNGRGDNNYEYVDQLSVRKGTHNFKFGGDVTRFQVNRFSDSNRGAVTFGSSYSGFAFANFMLGWADSATRSVGETHSYQRWTGIAGFVQDDWKITPNLTLNLGLRHELFTPISDPVSNRWVSFDPASGEIVIVGDGKNPRQNIALPEDAFPAIADLARTLPRRQLGRGDVWNIDKNNFAPRLGFAYRMGDGNVLRGGYGVFYDMIFPNIGVNGLGNNFPFVFAQTVNGNAGVPNVFYRDDPLVNARGGTVNVAAADMNIRIGYVQNWTLGVQRSLSTNWLLDVNYIGNKSSKLQRSRNINQPYSDGSAASVASRRPYALYGNITRLEDQIAGTYHALQAKLEKRFASGLQLTTAYTWGHSIDNDGTQNIWNLRQERGTSDFDVRQRLVFNYVYDLPLGSGKALAGSAGRMVNALVGNWQITGILTLQDGNSLTPTMSGNWSNTGSTTSRADVVPGVSSELSKDQRSPDHWFNAAAFSAPVKNFFGNAGRNIIAGPPIKELDFSLFKNIVFSETRRLQFRAEVFNVTNTPSFGLPVTDINSANVGQIRATTTSARQIQFGAKLNF